MASTDRTIHSRINASPQVIATETDVALPILWGDDNASVVSGVVLTDTGLAAGADGRMLLRPGTILVPDTIPGEYRVALTVVDVAGDPGDPDAEPDPIPETPAAESVLVLKTTADLAGGKGIVGAYYRAGLLGKRMPSLADNAVAGLEAPAKAALRTRGFVFGEDFGPHGR